MRCVLPVPALRRRHSTGSRTSHANADQLPTDDTAQVALVWQQPFHVGTILFLLNRYLIVLLYFVDFITLFPIIPSVRVYWQMHWSN